LDADLDGGADILLAPASPAEAPGYFHNNHDGPETTFADLTEIAGVRVDSAYAITAISAVDIAGASDTPDGDEDLYIGRASSSNAFFYQNAQGGTDAPTNKWLKVKLDPDNRPHNGSAIGVTVKAQTTLAGSVELIQTQIVDGGRGVGGQGAAELTFGLSNTTDSVDLTITWPDGYTQTESVANANLNQTLVVVDEHPAGLLPSTISAYAVLQPQLKADWVFEWQTNYLCDPSLDRVEIDRGSKAPPSCNYDGTILYANSTSQNIVAEVVAIPNGRYLHRLTWRNRDCQGGCSYKIRVSSSVGTGAGMRQTSTDQPFSTPYCAN